MSQKIKRSEQREEVLKLLYEKSFHDEDVEETEKPKLRLPRKPPIDEEIESYDPDDCEEE